MFICGDTNSRTSDIPGYVPLHVCEDLPDLIAAQPNTLYRSNVDRTVNSYGRRLIDLCKYAGLQICNGRLCASKHTCYKYNGESVVDYLLAPSNFFYMIRNFQIFDKLVYSDHYALSFALSGHGHLRKNLVFKNHREKIKTYLAVYKWNPDLLPAYRERLLNMDCINLCDQLLNKITGVNLDSGAAVDTFNDYMITAIGPLFSKRNNNRTGTFPVNAWFDKEFFNFFLLQIYLYRVNHSDRAVLPWCPVLKYIIYIKMHKAFQIYLK